ncbi:fibronectin type III domain-containing protein [Verrucomicrobia bacterium]|nr:fibronectin type III domain-containing protein [Verrucomicrobiota bacterium]
MIFRNHVVILALMLWWGHLGSVLCEESVERLWSTVVHDVLIGEGVLPLIDSEPDKWYTLKEGSYRGPYHYQDSCMIFTLAACRLDRADWKQDVVTGLQCVRQLMEPLHQLRTKHDSGSIILDDHFLLENRSGPSDKRVFAFQRMDEEGRLVRYWNDITEKQISGYIGFAICQLAQAGKDENTTTLLVDLCDYLVREYLYMLDTEIEGWHWGGAFPTTIDRLEQKLTLPLSPKLQEKIYYSAILDAEWWIMASAAYAVRAIELLGLNSRYPIEVQSSLRRILELTRLSFAQRTKGAPYFEYDLGAWNGRPEYDWAKRLEEDFPNNDTPPVFFDQATIDTSHFRRMPWVLLALEEGDKNNHRFYRQLRENLAKQFSERILYFRDERYPMISNYPTGHNGWYSLKFDRGWGYGPGALSYSLIQGSWASLGEFGHTNIRDCYNNILDIVTSNDEEDIKFRTNYYGKITYPVEGKGNLLSELDTSGPGSLAEARLRIIELLANLDMVTELVVPPGSSDSIVPLEWTALPSARRYDVERRKLLGFAGEGIIREVDSNRMDDQNVADAHSYEYRVRGRNEFGNGSWSDWVLGFSHTTFEEWVETFQGGQLVLDSDLDRDGLTLIEEYIFGTDPQLSDEAIPQLSITAPSERGLPLIRITAPFLHWRSDLEYSLQISKDLVSWDEIASGSPLKPTSARCNVVSKGLGLDTVEFEFEDFVPERLFCRLSVRYGITQGTFSIVEGSLSSN